MELIVISQSKLKITLTPPDMVKYALEGEKMDSVDPRTRMAFRHIFRDVRAESGFDTEGYPLFIQLYASKGGGCEIFVTKLEDAPPLPAADGETIGADASGLSAPLTEGEKKLLDTLTAEEVIPMEPTVIAAVRVFSFTELKDLTNACGRLFRGGYGGKSAAYILESPVKDVWYLTLEGPLDELLSCAVREHGTECSVPPLFLGEHGRVILEEQAVGILACL
jgi:negative regulator of genetic competence, sporulation and motility